MAREAQQSTNWDFKVEPMRLNLPDGTNTSVFANVRTDTNKVVGVISEKGYGLIQNVDFVTTVRSALESLGLTDYAESIVATQGGSRLYATYTFNNRVRSLSKVGDKVGMRLRFANSFDGSVAAMGELMAMVLRCLNGMVLEDAEFALCKRHTPKINLDFVKDVTAKSVQSFEASLALFDAMGERQLTDEQGIAMLSHLPLSNKVREAIGEIWVNPNFAQSKQRTMYALYDAATEYLRDVEGERFEYAQRTNRIILRKLVGALEESTFAMMIKPVVEVDESVQVVETEILDAEVVTNS